MTTPYTIWALIDDRPGNATQVLGVAEHLATANAQVEYKHISYSKLSALPNALLGASAIGVTKATRKALKAPWPAVVIGAGRRMVPVMRAIKKRSPSTKLVYLMHPQVGLQHLDLIAIPQHDEPPQHPRVMSTLGTPHRITRQMADEAAAQWSGVLSHLREPRIAVLLGGSSNNTEYTMEDWQRLGAALVGLRSRLHASLLITTSRRTGAEATQLLQQMLQGSGYFHAWDDGGENPYLALLALADGVVVTGESMAMCSEACAMGKPVWIATPATGMSNKYTKLHQALYQAGYAKPFGQQSALDWKPPAPLIEAKRVADRILEIIA